MAAPDDGSPHKIIEWAKEGHIELYLRKDNKRTIGHGIVGSKTDKICILEDPHDEFKELAATEFQNSRYFCDELRSKVDSLLGFYYC